MGEGIRSWLGVPLMHGEQLVGVLALDKAEPDFYTQLHAQTALAFAAIVGFAIASDEAGEAYA